MTEWCPNCERQHCKCLIHDVELKIKLLHEDSKVPVKAHEDDACFDLFAYVGRPEGLYHYFKPGEIQLVSLGFSMALPSGWEAQIRPRSGLSLKKGLSIVNSPGTIDAGFRNEVKVIFINLGHQPIEIHHGDKIAQMKISKVPKVKISIVDQLDETDRNLGGFGSTDKTP